MEAPTFSDVAQFDSSPWKQDAEQTELASGVKSPVKVTTLVSVRDEEGLS